MVYRKGDLVKNLKTLEWDIGEVVNIERQNVIDVYFLGIGEIKKLHLSHAVLENVKITPDELIEKKHFIYLKRRGIELNSKTTRSPRSPRTNVCHMCRKYLNNSLEPECVRCEWIVCSSCGACGCIGASRLLSK